MNAAPPQAPAGTEVDVKHLGRRRRRSQIGIAAGLVLILAAGGAVALKDPFRGTGQVGTPAASSEYPTRLYRVTRQTLTSQTPVNATLGYAGSYSVTGQGGGTLTWLPAVGQVISQGGVLFRVNNGTPVLLLYGSVPLWRALSEGLAGADVQQLNADLVALGYASKSELDPDSDYFSAETADAVYLLQARLGLTPTGSLAVGQAVFEPSEIRVTTVSGSLGGPASGQVLQATSDQRIVTVPLETTEESGVQLGDQVTITLPTGQITPGVVTSIGSVATTPSSGGTPTITVDVSPSDPAATGNLDQAPVQVSITTGTVPDALVVPVDALLAEPGGYAVEEAMARGGRTLVRVTLGLFDDANGMVQVTGIGLTAGQRIVLPQL